MSSSERIGMSAPRNDFLSKALSVFNSSHGKDLLARSKAEKTEPIKLTTETWLTYSEEEFKAAELRAKAFIKDRKGASGKFMVRVYHIDPEIGFNPDPKVFNPRHGVIHMTSKDNIHGALNKGFSEE